MLQEQLQHKIDFKTKPLGSLGDLEKLALQIGLVQNNLTPQLNHPHLIVFAADHGIAKEGVSAYPAEVTPQMVLNFVNQGAAINVFCKQNKITLKVVDAGVNFDFKENPNIIHHKVAYSTQSFLSQKAITTEELEKCFQYSEQLIDDIAKTGCNIIGFGEMGIGNTSSATMIINALSNIQLKDVVGRGTGLDDAGLQNKLNILQKAKDFHGEITAPKEVLQTFGGFEIAQMTGAMLSAFQKNMLIMVDGFIASAAFLVAYHINPSIKKNAIFCHQSDEAGHRLLLEYLEVNPLLKLSLRVGEGTGCALAYPLIQSAVHFLNEMASFESAGVSNQ
ncbi:nicotinate-nucleotide--dimethylbenzimidazole phosphoribosyltransferase [Elizabethkingia sp. JS20170427COW]|uniref:nicotinate-nucleotide--dimethylbenzimidazole phosphoribosyltransferase n=1 Tax=Elizabethkingia sp. JS20170427COW TaxID=2583851 RepID=UPI001110B162|nr:nicotinate-nucleotide--dimethylbenzimidazole phosphoribosyltransferase [Elizabethkingia sp. JS20170427COW]QCX53889.1 nicotinate-nucleotide--dimethylbenzimidazole phosphoribosyltransferase [Elizabethkingia sp. JS20170427COW]